MLSYRISQNFSIKRVSKLETRESEAGSAPARFEAQSGYVLHEPVSSEWKLIPALVWYRSVHRTALLLLCFLSSLCSVAELRHTRKNSLSTAKSPGSRQ